MPADIRLSALHEVIQLAFDWTNSHLHHFEAGRLRYGTDFDDLEFDGDEKETRLSDIASEGHTIRYLYDYGDGWEHELKVEQAAPGAVDVAICTGGRRAAPPDDCGGIGGYADLCAKMADGDTETLQWLGGPFDPAAFDKNEITERLAAIPVTD